MTTAIEWKRERFLVGMIVGHHVTVIYKDNTEIERPIPFECVDEAYSLMDRAEWIDGSEMPKWASRGFSK